jgi:hypothetical protein
MKSPGRSAQSEYERLRQRRREKISKRWPLILIGVAIAFVFGLFLPKLIFMIPSALLSQLSPEAAEIALPVEERLVSLATGLALALGAGIGLIRPSRSELAWRKGASGEREVGRALGSLSRKGVASLHDLTMLGSRANIDHVAVGPSGVFVVDAKRYKGRLQVRSRGSGLWINGRNRSHLLDQVRTQAKVVEGVLVQAGLADVTVQAALCFVDTKMPLFSPKRVDGVILCTPNTLRRRLAPTKAGGLEPRSGINSGRGAHVDVEACWILKTSGIVSSSSEPAN